MILFFSGGTHLVEKVIKEPALMFSYYVHVFDNNGNRPAKRMRRLLKWKKKRSKK